MFIIPPRNLSLLSLTPILHTTGTQVTTLPGTPTTIFAAHAILAPAATITTTIPPTAHCSLAQNTTAATTSWGPDSVTSIYFHVTVPTAASQLEEEKPTPGATKLLHASTAYLETPSPSLLPELQALPGNLTICPPIELIFARGTNEPPGLGRIGTALFIELQEFFPDMTAYGVFYSALAYKGRFFSGESLESGAVDVVDRVSMWEEHKKMGLCLETRIVLGGFSLGAAVVQKADLTAAQQDLVDAVVIFGYPWHFRSKPGLPYPIPAEKVWTRCISQDPVCNKDSIFSDGTFKAHKIYGEYVGEAVDFVLRRLGLS